MMSDTIITAAIIIIGNEILSGRTQDANIAHIAKKLNEHGVHVMEVRIIPDDEEMIINTVRHLKGSYDHVFTTGGIGPTHDDITAGSMAKAFDRELEFNPTAVEIMKKRYNTEHLGEGRLNMARMPVGASLISNPVTAVPGFQVENVYVMAGVPEIMRGMLDDALSRIQAGEPIVSVAVQCMLPEGNLAPGLRELQEQHPDVEIGSYPFWKLGQLPGTAVVTRGQDKSKVETVTHKVRELMQTLGGEPQD